MKNQKSFAIPPRIFAVSILALTLISIALRCINLLFFFNTIIGYYDSGAILPILTDLTVVLSVLFFGFAALMHTDKQPITRRTLSLPSRICAALTAVAFLYLSLTDLIAGISVFCILLDLCAAVYFALLTVNFTAPAPRMVGCLGVSLRLLLAMASIYSEVMIPMNAPDKILLMLACVIGTLFLVCDLRCALANGRPFLYRFATASATLFFGIASLPALFGILTKSLNTASEPRFYLLLAALFAYSLSCITEWFQAKPNQTDSTVAHPDTDITNDELN